MRSKDTHFLKHEMFAGKLTAATIIGTLALSGCGPEEDPVTSSSQEVAPNNTPTQESTSAPDSTPSPTDIPVPTAEVNEIVVDLSKSEADKEWTRQYIQNIVDEGVDGQPTTMTGPERRYSLRMWQRELLSEEEIANNPDYWMHKNYLDTDSRHGGDSRYYGASLKDILHIVIDDDIFDEAKEPESDLAFTTLNGILLAGLQAPYEDPSDYNDNIVITPENLKKYRSATMEAALEVLSEDKGSFKGYIEDWYSHNLKTSLSPDTIDLGDPYLATSSDYPDMFLDQSELQKNPETGDEQVVFTILIEQNFTGNLDERQVAKVFELTMERREHTDPDDGPDVNRPRHIWVLVDSEEVGEIVPVQD